MSTAAPRSRHPLRVASYNIHRCRGVDGIRSFERIASVIRELEADVVALQEVEVTYESDGSSALEALAAATGYAPVAGPTLEKERWDYGNALLVRHPVIETRRLDLSVGGGREPRGAVEATLDLGTHVVGIVGTHFGLRGAERRSQTCRLLEALGPLDRPLLLLGDFNEWWPFSRVLRRLRSRLGPSRAVRTFPARWPVLPLDRIWASRPAQVHELRAHTSPLARIASDHLPLCALVGFRGGPESL